MSKELFDTLIKDIQEGNIESVESKVAELSEEQLNALFGEAQPFKALGTASSDRIVIGSVSNLREKYLKKLITTAMVAFLFQMKNEYTLEESDLIDPPIKDDFYEEAKAKKLPDNYNTDILHTTIVAEVYKERYPDGELINFKDMENALSEEDLIEVGKKENERYAELTNNEKIFNAPKYDEAMHKAIQHQSDEERVIIERFLKRLFKFDKDHHIQKGQHEINDDPERVDISLLKDTVYENIPPNDTHCRFNSYYEINYEKMREATKHIYNLKPDLEHAMIVYDVVDKQKDVDDFIHKYGSSSKYDIVSFPLNKWTLMGPFSENRSRVDYYNKHNSIIKSILEQQEKDAALGEDLMKKRIKHKKVKAEKIFGKDSPQFNEYRKLSPSELEQKYNATIEELDDGSIKVTREVTVNAETGEEIKIDEDGVPDNALEVPITTINAKTGETSQSRMFTASEKN